MDGFPGGIAPCSSGTKSYSSLDDGTYRFEVRAITSGGLKDLSPATYTWRVDTTKPEVVGQIMHTPKDGLRSVTTGDGIAVAADLLGHGRQQGVPVVDDSGRLAGLIDPATMTAVLFQHEALDYVRGDEA